MYCGDALVVDLSGGQRPFSLRQITPVPQTMPRRTVWTNVRTSSLRASLARYLEGIVHLASPVIARQSTLRSHFSFNLSCLQVQPQVLSPQPQTPTLRMIQHHFQSCISLIPPPQMYCSILGHQHHEFTIMAHHEDFVTICKTVCVILSLKLSPSCYSRSASLIWL